MKNYIALLLTMLLAVSCYIPQHEYYKNSPIIEVTKASCHYNYSHQDYVWYFDAWVHYPHYKFEDVSEVWVEVYDGYRLVNIFPLFRDREKFWTSSWIEETETNLWCGDPYEIDFIAIDVYGNYDIMTVYSYY
jgi:hypothetical protein